MNASPIIKPLALLRRIIEAYSNVEDVVPDLFCGCAIELESAQDIKRNWIGIDVSPIAVALIRIRFRKELNMLRD